MDILKSPLTIIFKEQNPYRVLHKYFINNIKDNYTKIDDKKFIYLSQFECPQCSREELEIMLEVIKDKMNKTLQGTKFDKCIFNLIINYAENVLDDTGNDVRCKYKDLLKWRMTSHKLDQDLFISSYLAYKDLLIGRDRKCFDWDTTIKSNNIRLNNMLSQGMAENHFHLKGSAPTFYLSWISIMNNIRNRKLSKIDLDKNRLEPDLEKEISIKESLVIAAYLRLILFRVVNKINMNTDEELQLNYIKHFKGLLQDEDTVSELFLKMYSRDIQKEISILKHLYGKELMHKNNRVKVDYAITSNVDTKDISTRLFSGERSLMYNCFKLIYKDDKEFKEYKDLFYAYIIIKSKFRTELIQANDRVGFSNFADYQDRKTGFIPKNTIIKDEVESTAILTSIKKQKLVSIEARVIPFNQSAKNIEEIKRIDNIICNQVFNDGNNSWEESSVHKKELSISMRKLIGNKEEKNSIKKLREKYFYVYHFPKKRDPQCSLKEDDLSMIDKCRHAIYRKDLKKWAIAIYKMREKNSDVSKRVLGIDACSNEIITRPEVFGQAFRFLKSHLPSEDFQKIYMKDNSIGRLRATFHVGEDFLDIIDGLRAIDECVTFLNFTHGDRLGHAIVLGIDVEEWYEKKFYKVNLTKQAILDNIAWLIKKIREFDIEDGPKIIEKLTPIYNKYYLEIFDDSLVLYSDNYGEDKEKIYKNAPVIPVDTYMEAWKLRGDNPEWYIDKNIQHGLSFWDRCAKRESNSQGESNNLVENIYINYHFNPKVKVRGYKKEIFKIEPYIVEAVKKIQKEMQIYIRQRGIGIECNPSSNYLISNFKRYDKHPILNFYNLGLTIDENEAKDCPQMFVSINTDDQGVFGTLLGNEFALMGIALEKAKDKNGKPLYNQSMIYDWLDRVRKMGIEQSFGKPNY